MGEVIYIDVSQYQGKIDWSKVKCAGVFIRAGYRGYSAGVIKEDAQLENNLKGATEAGLPIGLYFMSQAISESEADAEAQFCADIMKRYKITLPVVYDSEYSGEKNYNGRADNLTRQQRTNMARRFCDTLKQMGIYSGIYSGTWWYTAKLIPEQLKNRGYFIWNAQYASQCKLTALDWELWQFTSKGSMNGITGNVDMSRTKTGDKIRLPDNTPTVKEENKILVEDGLMTLSQSRDRNKRFYIGDKPTNFKVYEFACHNGNDTILVSGKLVKALQKIREHFNAPVSITSAYRTAEYNKKVGGAKNSYHVQGMAADITVTGISNREVAKFAASFLLGVGLYNYTGGFVHVDTRTSKYFWQQDAKNSKYYGVKGFDDTDKEPTLRYNDRGEAVKKLQTLLGIKADGIFKSQTEQAVRNHQKSHGLVVDGIVGPKTWASLKEV